MRLILRAAALLTFGTLAACDGTGSDGAKNAAADSSTSASPTQKTGRESAACDLLTAEQREELAGTPVDHSVPIDSASATYQCRWSTRADAANRALIQVTSTPAHAWAEDLPAAISQLEESAPQLAQKHRDQIDRVSKVLESSETVSDEEACGLSTTMVEVNGGGKDAKRTASYIDLAADTKAISAQTCTDGVFTSVVYGTPDLEPSTGTESAVFAALRRAHFTARQDR